MKILGVMLESPWNRNMLLPKPAAMAAFIEVVVVAAPFSGWRWPWVRLNMLGWGSLAWLRANIVVRCCCFCLLCTEVYVW